MTVKNNLLNFSYEHLQNFILQLNEKKFRAQQLMQWIYQKGCIDFAQMTNLGKSLQQKLNETAVVELPKVASYQESKDGTFKWQIALHCGNLIETVFIPEKLRGTLCVSSQVGCALNCSFCSTGKQGFNRNLTTAEIIGQLWLATKFLSPYEKKITNIVMMGMGEPLLNFDNVVVAMDLMLNDFAYGLSKRRVTLSTAGLVPAMKKLKERSSVSLAVSLHAPNDELRNQLVPINKKYPLVELMALCKEYFHDEPRRKVTFEYVMLQDVNDQVEHAHQLIKLLKNIPAKVNLIPFNPFKNADYQRSSANAIEKFRNLLMEAGINTITRKTRGDDIDAACGQLAGKIEDKTKRTVYLANAYLKKTSS